MKKIKIYLFAIAICITLVEVLPAFAITLPKEKNSRLESGFIGKWRMKTIVTFSSCPDVLVGSTTESKLEIKPLINSKIQNSSIKAFWKGGNWKKSIGTVKLLNEKEAITERVTRIKTSRNENWEAVLIDHLNLEEKDIIHTESIVIQYKNGNIVGEYKTYSILTRLE